MDTAMGRGRKPHACTAADGGRCYCGGCWKRVSAEREEYSAIVRQFLEDLRRGAETAQRITVDGTEGHLGCVAVLLCGEQWMLYWRCKSPEGHQVYRKALVTEDRAQAHGYAVRMLLAKGHGGTQ